MGKIHNLSEELFESPYFFLLESSMGGRYTIAGWEPSKVITCHANEAHFFDNLREELSRSPKVETPYLATSGGWIGYLGYELYS